MLASEHQAATADGPRPLATAKILLIEDDAGVRHLARSMLRRIEITQVTEAVTGVEALLKEDAERFDLVVCDWHLPDLAGIEILRIIRGRRPQIPFLMLTGQIDADSVMMAKKLGVSAYVAKPVSPRIFQTRVRALLGDRFT